MNADPLIGQLRDFAQKLAAKNIRLIIGGGYGLLLKANQVQLIGARTRLERIPVARSTADIDVFLSTEVITDKTNMAAIRQALDEMDYSPVPGAEYYQFFRKLSLGGTTRNLKFDFLAAPVLGEDAKKVGLTSAALDLAGQRRRQCMLIRRLRLLLSKNIYSR